MHTIDVAKFRNPDSDTAPPVTTFESRIRTVSVAVSPERSSMAWHCPDIERESLCPMTVQLIAYGLSSDDHLTPVPVTLGQLPRHNPCPF